MSATNPHSQRYMRLFAYLPLAFHPEARRRAASLLRLRCHGGRASPRAKRQENGCRGHFERGASLWPISIRALIIQIRCAILGCTTFVQDGRFFLQASPRQYDIISGEPPPPKVAGSVNLYTEEFFSLMKSRLKEGGIATFWLPINQLKVDEAKAILRAFHNAFPNASVWASADRGMDHDGHQRTGA